MNEFEKIIGSETPVLIDFFATWCGPCKMMHPILEDLKSQMGEKVKIYKIDVDKHEDIAREYFVQSVPTLIIFKNGAQMWRQSGVTPATTLKAELEKFL